MPQTPTLEIATGATPHEQVVLALTTFPDREHAAVAARAWIEAGLAACVHIAPAGRSIYRWQGAIESGEEVQVTAKTTAGRLEALSEALHRTHPYELPEFLLVCPSSGSSAYMEWVRLACQNGDDRAEA